MIQDFAFYVKEEVVDSDGKGIDWREKYNVEPHGFETFVVETDFRKGTVYKADNWIFLGETFGSTKSHKGLMNKSVRKNTNKKLIYAKKIPKTKLSTEYEATWNKPNKSKPIDKVEQVQEDLFSYEGS